VDPVLQRVCAIMAATFNVPASSITPATTPETLEEWDSMGHLTLMLALEQELEISIPPEDGERMKDVDAIVKTIRPLL
jgi:acyl carrier protein